MIIKIKPPKGWQNPKDAQMVVRHFGKYGASLELSIKDGVVEYGVFSVPDETPVEPAIDDTSKEAKQTGAELYRLAKLEHLVSLYTWQREEA